MSSAYRPIVVPPEKVVSINNEFAKMYEGAGAVKKSSKVGGGSGVANRSTAPAFKSPSGRAAPAFKSPSSRVVYKASPVARLISAMRQKKTFEELQEIMSPGSSPVKQAAGRACSNPTDLHNDSLPAPATHENKENMSRHLDGEGKPAAEVDKSTSDLQQRRSHKESQKDPSQETVGPPSKDAGSKATERRDTQTTGARKKKVMNWLASHDEELLQQHDPADLIVTPPSTERASDSGFSSRPDGDTNKSQVDDSMDDRESDDDTVKMNESDGTLDGTIEETDKDGQRNKDSNLKENEEDIDGKTVEEKNSEEDDNISEQDMDEEEAQEMEQPTNDGLSQSIAWADNTDNMSVDTTDTSRQEKAAAPKVTKDAAVKPFKEHVLYDWFIKPMRNSTDIVVEGHRKQDPEHQYWHSTAIVKRMHSRMVVTGSGTMYKLRGLIDRAMVLEQGFPAKVAKAFKAGFPENWREVLEDSRNSTSETEGEQRSNKQETSVSQRGHHKGRESLQSKKAVPNVPPRSMETVLGSLGRSRSGRVVKPRMAWWANQRVVIEKDNVKIDCTSNDELSKSPAFLSFRTVKGLIVHRDDLQDSRSGTPSTVKRRPATASTVRPAAKTVVEDPPRDPRDRRSDQHDPETALSPAKKKTRLEPQRKNDTVVTTDILLDTPGAPRGREALGTVQNSRLLRTARNKKPWGVPEDILNTPKPTHTFKNSKSGEEDTNKSRDQSSARDTSQSSHQKKLKAQEPPPRESEDKRAGKTAESKQRRGRPRGDRGSNVTEDTSIEQQPSTEKQVPMKGGARRGRQRKDDETSDGQTTNDVVCSATRKRGRPSNKKESSTVNRGNSENMEPEVKEAPSKDKSLSEEDDNQAEETDEGENLRRGRGRKQARSSASQDRPRRSPRLEKVTADKIEQKEEEPTMRQRGYRKGLQKGKTSIASRNSNRRKEQAESMAEETEVEKDSEDSAGKALENQGKGRRRYQRKKKANNNETEERETSPAVQLDQRKKTANNKKTEDREASPAVQLDQRKKKANNKKTEERETSPAVQLDQRKKKANNKKTEERETSPTVQLDQRKKKENNKKTEERETSPAVQLDQRKKKANNKKTEERETSPAVQLDQRKKKMNNKKTEEREASPAVQLDQRKKTANNKKTEEREASPAVQLDQRKKTANNKKTEERETSPVVQVDECESAQNTDKSHRKIKKNSPGNCKGRQAREQSKDNSETSWTLEEEKKLYSAINGTSAEDECMWQKVARMVGSHTAQDCQARYQEMTSTSTAKQAASSKDKEDSNKAEKEPKKPVVLTGKAGTLKRKRQIQELMKQYNEGHEDEAFEDGITPFKKQRKISKGLISIDYNADEDDDVRTDVATRQAFQTPMSRLFGHSTAAAEPTPKGLSLRTPGAIGEEVHKSNLDKYVFKQQKAKKGKAINSGPIKTLGGSRKAGKKTKVSNIDFSKLLTAQMLMEEDDSDEEDDYFSDNGD
ncbi:MIS18BP1 [Branchiostoma lanceolatum]|uniref:MIS18BP1 protein n=1 Tax=Branchiostoma lanceolatum TaxID=7740 RepID=A0A8J9ZZE6_BRALA|nr:MIS18BP1 [Branchiostoma lanceolatum]